MSQIIFGPFGSLGDVHPFLRSAARRRRRTTRELALESGGERAAQAILHPLETHRRTPP